MLESRPLVAKMGRELDEGRGETLLPACTVHNCIGGLR